MIGEWRPEAEARRALYGGDVLRRGATTASLALVEKARALLAETFADVGDPRLAQAQMDPAEYFRRMGGIRRTLYLEPEFQRAMLAVIEAGGFTPDEYACDPVRLRIVHSAGHTDPRAKPVYYGHRDTWYGHSQSLLTWWIPLDDLPADQHRAGAGEPGLDRQAPVDDQEAEGHVVQDALDLAGTLPHLHLEPLAVARQLRR